MLGGAGSAPAQFGPPVALDPTVGGRSTTLLVTAGESLLSANGRPAQSITISLPRGMRVDSSSREQLCAALEARRAACPESSRIGFGHFAAALRGYAPGGGETELGWSIDAFLGKPLRRGEAASVVLVSKLLGADLVGKLLAPNLGADVPASSVSVGRLRRTSGRYGAQLGFDRLPVEFDVEPPVTAAPARLELSLGAMRRVRRNFTRRLKVRTPDGHEIRRIKDHRLVGHSLFRAPACNGSWFAEVSTGFADGSRRTTVRIPCLKGGR